MDAEDRSPPRAYSALSIFYLTWGLVLLGIGGRYLYLNPIVPWPSPTAVALDPRLADSSAATAGAPSPTFVPTWTPVPTPTSSSTPSVTPTYTPSPSATATRALLRVTVPSPRPLQNPTLAPLSVTPPITTVTAIPTIVPRAEVPDGVVNIMLLGSDKQSGSPSWRTDVIIVVSINPEGPSAAMLSIPRDLYVWIPGTRMAKINTVDNTGEISNYPGGGPGLLQQTLLYNLGIPIHYYARADFTGFERVVDTLGGLDVPVTCEMTDWHLKSPELDREDEENWELFTLDQQVHHMDGDLTLWYVRSRKKSSDFDRSRRQQQVLRAMMAKGLALDVVPQLPQLWSDMTEAVQTNLGLGEMVQLAAIAPRLEFSKIKSRFLNGDAVVAWTTPNDDAYVLLPQYEEVAKIVVDVFEPPAENRAFQSPPVVEVWNGTARPEIDLLAVDNLLWEGLVPVMGQADRQDYANTQVFYYGQSFKGASTWRITKLFGVTESQMVLQPEPNSPVDYRVILGYDFDPCVHRVRGAKQSATPTPTLTPAWTPPPD